MRTRYLAIPLAALFAAGCSDDPKLTDPGPEEPKPAPTPIGVYDFIVTGIGTPNMSASVQRVDIDPVTGAASAALNPTGNGMVMEALTVTTFREGSRGRFLGQRYVTSTFRVRNGTGVARNNVTFIPIKHNTIYNTPFSKLRMYDGTDADSSIATRVVPTGVVAMGDGQKLLSPIQDALQVYEEAEVAGIPLPSGATIIFPYGFPVRHARNANSRVLPATTDPEQYDGVVSISYRVPLQVNQGGLEGSKDVYSFVVRTLAVEDTEVRMTESIEEGQDSAAVRRLRARAAAMGATTVTVLAGSPAVDPAVADYPGQRQICSVRTAGTAASPETFITSPGAYTGLMILRPGEAMDPCAAYFRTGTPERPATWVPFPVTVKAVDRYGNVKKLETDSIHLDVAPSGPSASFGPGAPLDSGSVSLSVMYLDYGNSNLFAVGRRMRGELPIPVAGVTRTWTGAASTTNWTTGANWMWGAAPMSLDSVYIPASAPFMPALVSNVSIGGVTVENGATLNLGSFDLTASANVSAGLTGGITNTTGRLVLAGTAKTIVGRVPRLRVTGTYSLTGNVVARAPIEVAAGRLTSAAYRLQAESF